MHKSLGAPQLSFRCVDEKSCGRAKNWLPSLFSPQSPTHIRVTYTLFIIIFLLYSLLPTSTYHNSYPHIFHFIYRLYSVDFTPISSYTHIFPAAILDHLLRYHIFYILSLIPWIIIVLSSIFWVLLPQYFES